jgi:dCTP deaminase
MSLLSYLELCELVEQGVINAPIGNVNGSSIDLTLHHTLLLESNLGANVDIDLSNKESINTHEFVMDDSGYLVSTGEFLLASTNEIYNLPADISCEYKLKSTMARNGLEHLNAGWADAWWHGSKLTLEFKNFNRYHNLLLKPNMKIGQMVFFRHTPVPKEFGYAIKGQYNNQKTVTASKGIV